MVSRKCKGNYADGMYSVGFWGRSACFGFNTKVNLVTIRRRDLGVIR